MLTEQEALTPVLLSIVRDILVADHGAYDDLRVEADEIAWIFEGTKVSCEVPEITDLYVQAARCAETLTTRLRETV